MAPGQYLAIVAGLAVLLLAFHDLFQSVVMPRPSVHRFPLRTSNALIRGLWIGWRWVGTRPRHQERRENLLGVFGPAAVLMLLGFWFLSLLLGYGLVLYGLRDQIQPRLDGLWTSLYFSGATLLPLSYGNLQPIGGAARVTVLAESASGVILMALVIALLFSLYQSFKAREELVVTLDALAGAPPSGLHLLEAAAADRMPQEIGQTFNEWRRWSASVLESHLAYPILFYFRSSHDNEAWLNSFGAVMDAATLVLSTIEPGSSTGAARLMFKVGNHLVEDVVWYFRLRNSGEIGVGRQAFEEARARLRAAGYRCRDPESAWRTFVDLRRRYASPVELVAQRLAIMPAEWIGDRTYLPHRSPSRRGRRPWQPH